MRHAWALGLALGIAACGGGPGPGDAGPDDPGADGTDAAGDVSLVCVTVADCAALDPGPCGRVACGDGGRCEVRPDAGRDGAACEPADRCAVGGGACRSGACVPAARKTCPERPCLTGQCDEATGECRYESVADGQACEADDNPCTSDQCVGGACQAGANTCPCTVDDDCPKPVGVCDPRMTCDADAGACAVDPASAACPAPADPCQAATCDEAAGGCVTTALPDYTECETASACRDAGTCLDGACQRRPRCDDGDPCTLDACDEATGECSHGPASGAACEDGDPCTTDDTCQAGACVGGPARDCDDGNGCTTDACVSGQGCTWTAVEVGTACDDGDGCTVDDACGPGGLCAGTALDCDDHNSCTEDACDAEHSTCRNTPLDAVPCEDGHVCTAGDTCRTGTCVPGPWTPACCEEAADCDDGDACTTERCEGGMCLRDGEAAGRCEAPQDACGAAWCRAPDGQCEALDLRLPRRLLAWDLRAGGAAAGLSWSGVPGVRGADGASGAADGASATLRLPGRRVPAGLVVLVLDLGASACGTVAVLRDGGAAVPAAACGPVDGRTRAAWTWAATGDPLDVAVRLGDGSMLAGLDLYLWAQGGCAPLGPVLAAGGDGYSALRLAGGPDSVLLAALHSDEVVATGYRVDAGVAPARSLDTELLPNPDHFTVSAAVQPDGQYLVAYGGVRDRTMTTLFTPGGTVGAPIAFESAIFSADDRHFDPDVVNGPDGSIWIGWSLAPQGSTDYDLGLARGHVIAGTPVFETAGTQLDVDAAGVQRRPRLAVAGDGGVAAWISEQAGPSNRVVLRRLGPDGLPVGDEVPVDAGTDALKDLALAPVGGDRVVWVAERGAGVFHGGVRASGDLGEMGTVELPTDPLVFRYRPRLAGFDSGALLVAVADDGSESRIRQSFVSGDGTSGAEALLSPRIEASSAYPALARLGPFWAVVGFADVSPLRDPGLYLTLTAPACIEGPVDCREPANPRVCVGFGPTGYASLPGATGWCP